MPTNNTSNDDFIQVNYTGQEINNAIGAALDTHGIPQGGTTGWVLQKASGTDFDVEWAAQSGGEVDQTYDALSENAQSGTAVAEAISGKENTSNKVTSISAQSTDTQYPSAKCVYDGLGTKQNTIDSTHKLPYTLLSDTPTIPTVDQTYDGTSANAQSGVAVASAISTKQNLIDNTITGTVSATLVGVDTTVTQGSSNLITSGAVYSVVGDIESLLAALR